MVVGGATGALSGAATDYGISDDFMKGLAKDIQPGSAALFMMLRDATLDRVLPDLAQHGGTLLYTNLSKDVESGFAQDLASGTSPTPTPAPTQSEASGI